MSHYKQGNLDLDAFVTERIKLEDVEAAFDKMHEGKVPTGQPRSRRVTVRSA